MIPMSCPNCGRRGTIPPERLNTRMHCKKCDAVFHMDKSGKIVVGDPEESKRVVATAQTATDKKKKVKKRGERELIELSGRELINKIPKPVLYIALGGVLLFLIFGLKVIKIPKFGGGSYGEKVESRITYVANAFVDEQPGKILDLAVEGTGDELQKWYDELRPRLAFEGPQKLGSTALISALIEGNEGDKELNYIMRINLPFGDEEPQEFLDAKKVKFVPPDIQPGYKASGSFDAPLHWVKTDDNGWRIDGTASLALLAPKSGDGPKK